MMGNAHSSSRNRLVNGVVRMLTRINENTKLIQAVEEIRKNSREGGYEKERAELEKKIEEEEAAKIAAFNESRSTGDAHAHSGGLGLSI